MSRWPIIRHIRWAINLWMVNRHYAAWGSLGMHDGNRKHDDNVLRMIWRGEY